AGFGPNESRGRGRVRASVSAPAIFVMLGLVPGIHAFGGRSNFRGRGANVEVRVGAGHLANSSAHPLPKDCSPNLGRNQAAPVRLFRPVRAASDCETPREEG